MAKAVKTEYGENDGSELERLQALRDNSRNNFDRRKYQNHIDELFFSDKEYKRRMKLQKQKQSRRR